MNHKRIYGVIFDLDGTITDSKEGILDSLEYSLKKMDCKRFKRADLHYFIGEPLKKIYSELLGSDDTESIEKAVSYYREHFAEHGIKNNRVYPHMENLLKSLYKKRSKVFLTTIKPRVYAKRILEMYKLIDYFTEVYGSELDGKNSTKEELISLVLENNRAENRFLMIGDRASDIEGGKIHNLETVGVKYGYSKPGEIDNAEPTFIAESVDDLRKILTELEMI